VHTPIFTYSHTCMQAMGNARAALYWEANLPRDFRRPPENEMARLRTFIMDKYCHRSYCVDRRSEPPTIENWAHHPVCIDAESWSLSVLKHSFYALKHAVKHMAEAVSVRAAPAGPMLYVVCESA
jgi:hypothetical protein